MFSAHTVDFSSEVVTNVAAQVGVDPELFESYGTYNLAAYYVPGSQTFALPLTVAPIINGVPSAGGGSLETKASPDLYDFAVPAEGKSLFLDFMGCASQNASPYISYLKWQVINRSTGAKVGGDYCRSGDKQLDAIPAGDYTLEISADTGSYGTYNLRASYVS